MDFNSAAIIVYKFVLSGEKLHLSGYTFDEYLDFMLFNTYISEGNYII